jgi:hypothetical protein
VYFGIPPQPPSQEADSVQAIHLMLRQPLV